MVFNLRGLENGSRVGTQDDWSLDLRLFDFFYEGVHQVDYSSSHMGTQLSLNKLITQDIFKKTVDFLIDIFAFIRKRVLINSL